MSKPPLLVVGAGGHARACIDVLEQEDRFRIVGLIGLPEEVGGTVLGYPIIGSDGDIPGMAQDIGNALVAIGQIRQPEPRRRAFLALAGQGWSLPTIVSPHAHVSRHAKVGAGTIVMHGAVVNAGAVIGSNCIVNSNALIEHDATIGDHCHISTSAVLNGGVCVGERSFVGSGSVVREGVLIGTDCFIGLGSRVLKDCEPGSRIPN